jgi:hypothetical protein
MTYGGRVVFFALLLSVGSVRQAAACSCGGWTPFVDFFKSYQGSTPTKLAAIVETQAVLGRGVVEVTLVEALKGTPSGTKFTIRGQDGGNCNGPVETSIGKKWVVAIAPDKGGYSTLICGDTSLDYLTDDAGVSSAASSSPLGTDLPSSLTIEALKREISVDYSLVAETLSCQARITDLLAHGFGLKDVQPPKKDSVPMEIGTTTVPIQANAPTVIELSAPVQLPGKPLFDEVMSFQLVPSSSGAAPFVGTMKYVSISTLKEVSIISGENDVRPIDTHNLHIEFGDTSVHQSDLWYLSPGEVYHPNLKGDFEFFSTGTSGWTFYDGHGGKTEVTDLKEVAVDPALPVQWFIHSISCKIGYRLLPGKSKP